MVRCNCLVVFYVFFFKQKTAYEMRISDWSSDVCSSDLPKPYWPKHQDKLRFQSIFFATPDSAKGTSFLNVWPYDQHSFPDLYGYVPAFKRIRQFPTDQRFEPLIPRSEEHTSELQSLMRISYAVFCLKKKNRQTHVSPTA